MEYGGISRDEMEVTIRLDRKDRRAYICSTWPEWSWRLERLLGRSKRETKRNLQVNEADGRGPHARAVSR
jgi:uncharacterized protein with beta-barrel porin domain